MPKRRLDVTKAKQDICDALRAKNTVTTACAYAGINKVTFYRWLARDSNFSTDVAKAEARADVLLISNIVKAAQGGSWQAAAWLMERHPRTKSEWRRSDEIDFGKLTIPQLLALATAGEEGAESTGDRVAAEAGEE